MVNIEALDTQRGCIGCGCMVAAVLVVVVGLATGAKTPWQQTHESLQGVRINADGKTTQTLAALATPTPVEQATTAPKYWANDYSTTESDYTFSEFVYPQPTGYTVTEPLTGPLTVNVAGADIAATTRTATGIEVLFLPTAAKGAK